MLKPLAAKIVPARALVGEIAVIVGEGLTGVEGRGVADVERFPHPVGRNSRPSERANTILENQRCFRNCDFMPGSPIKLSFLRIL